MSKEGRITNLQQTFGPKELASATTEAVQQWRYPPFVLMGEPADVETTVVINFRLATSAAKPN